MLTVPTYREAATVPVLADTPVTDSPVHVGRLMLSWCGMYVHCTCLSDRPARLAGFTAGLDQPDLR